MYYILYLLLYFAYYLPYYFLLTYVYALMYFVYDFFCPVCRYSYCIINIGHMYINTPSHECIAYV